MACRDGMSPADFWRTTPREFREFVKGVAERDKAEQALAMSSAWHMAVWSKWSKRPPPDLSRILARIGQRKRREQTPEQALRIATVLNAQMGGRDLRAQTKRSS